MTKVTILCEDIDQERFIRQYLTIRGLSSEDITCFSNPKGLKVKNNNASILKYYPKILKDYRRIKNYQDIAVIVMIDPDHKTVYERIRSLNMAVNKEEGERNKDMRLPNEKIAIFVPARNIETWFYYINGNQDCHEQDDYKNKTLNTTERITLAQASAIKLASDICPQGLDENAPYSLHHACNELQRLQLDK
ncbi:MAG: hypothetical protein F6K22_15290 [Okeania sp. SIO2F4]|uniref:hypothetical protein n=1 Tax=Okeania sp. SIO2F4 TaxID=2607790 RepID=UPI00142CCD68|nr:hypothetical protein [Okeania sp. SIO2F4]NES04075.1 hypothetical protein [Okeania sp. SIO2F4]